jgi:hypothetical protein
MHLTPSDPDIATLNRRIKQGRLDLQPNFQRGEVWGKIKKQRLIDSILRGWHIPPVHVIQVPGSDKQEVLDGQQRLAAIRDFIDGQFPINGEQPPNEDSIRKLNGLYWRDLHTTVQSKIEDFTIRILTISDYKPGEPGELFYRLNQPTNLTSAEQRNAYFGEARQQVKNLTEYMLNLGFSSELIGFSNSRMAYDDVLAKFLLTLEMRTLTEKHTANSVTARYRESTGFAPGIEMVVEDCLDCLFRCISLRKTNTKLNKATIFTWLIFIFEYKELIGNAFDITIYFDYFESIRERTSLFSEPNFIPKGITSDGMLQAIQIYQDRASSRVADVSSVVLRDLVLWGMFTVNYPTVIENISQLKDLSNRFSHLLSGAAKLSVDQGLSEISQDLKWGSTIC